LIPPNLNPPCIPAFTLLKNPCLASEVLQKEIQLLSEAISKRDLNSALESMKRLVPEYSPENPQ